MVIWRESRNSLTQEQNLHTKKGSAHFIKMDIFQRKMWFAYEDHRVGGIVELSLERVHEIIESNNAGKKPDKLEDLSEKS